MTCPLAKGILLHLGRPLSHLSTSKGYPIVTCPLARGILVHLAPVWLKSSGLARMGRSRLHQHLLGAILWAVFRRY